MLGKRMPRLAALLAGSSVVCTALFANDSAVSGANCTFKADPDRFLSAQSRARNEIVARTAKFRRASDAPRPRTVDARSIPHRNFIDDEIFGKLAAMNVPSAPLSSDEEFFRRINLDLTGRLPSPAEIRAFVADPDPGKRDRIIDQLLFSPQFVDKWVMWLGDLVRNSATNASSYSPEQLQGRTKFYKYLWDSLMNQKSLRDMAWEMVIAGGNNYDEDTGQVNFISSAGAPGGPVQDTYDAMLVKSATAFLGLSHYDCLLCHNGRGHLDQISLWGANTSRLDAQKMSAFFSRTNLTRWTPPAGTPQDVASQMYYYNSYSVTEVFNRSYGLSTNYGNRPNRTPAGNLTSITPVYRNGQTPQDQGWRSEFGRLLVDDPMFAVNLSNRLWKQMFGLGLVDPVDGLDPARLDPANPPQPPWTLQATHPLLLQKLSKSFVDTWYNLRETLRIIVSSSAYQLSSQYDDAAWNASYVPLFARHYPRRLDGEEVHDAICSATGIFNQYAQFGWGTTVSYAMQLLDSVEPRNNLGNAQVFMNYFFRGNRDTTPRMQASSLQQELALMNDTFVTAKLKVNASPALQAIAKLQTNDAIIDELWLTFISRLPTSYERERASSYLAAAATTAQRNAAIEDLAWVLVNKVDFLFSY
jgi:hypothetical protein